MARTASTMLELGTTAPDFQLPDIVSGQVLSLASVAASPLLLVMFISQHCPFVKHVEAELGTIGKDYGPKGLSIIAIMPNSLESHPQDGPAFMKEQVDRAQFNFAYCLDSNQAVAQAYQAACTPDFFLFGADRTLIYRGQLDDSRPSNEIPVTGKDLRAAIEAGLAGQPIDPNQKPSIGCNIKWKPGNEPAYYGA